MASAHAPCGFPSAWRLATKTKIPRQSTLRDAIFPTHEEDGNDDGKHEAGNSMLEGIRVHVHSFYREIRARAMEHGAAVPQEERKPENIIWAMLRHASLLGSGISKPFHITALPRETVSW